jgi:hypothetical protein
VTGLVDAIAVSAQIRVRKERKKRPKQRITDRHSQPELFPLYPF